MSGSELPPAGGLAWNGACFGRAGATGVLFEEGERVAFSERPPLEVVPPTLGDGPGDPVAVPPPRGVPLLGAAVPG